MAKSSATSLLFGLGILLFQARHGPGLAVVQIVVQIVVQPRSRAQAPPQWHLL